MQSTTFLATAIVIVLITPGPTNTLLAAAGLRQGVARAIPLIGAELAGYLISISLWGFFLITASRGMPWLGPALRIASGIYIGYLAVHMWRAAIALTDTGEPAITLRALFLATLLNPKGLLFASTVFPANAFTDAAHYARAMAEFAALLVPIALAWIAFGAGMGNGRLTWIDPVKVQRGASLVLGAFSLSLAWAAFR
ncbi:Putative threonine efflux protein [Caballeronia glathei]|uniref:Multidrug transporter MatE n=1 Tax=Caballeronia glathei TaxID=60547 RepID=A0A069PJX1_9BURK|nr:LysE family transporter [Caballeronia glathei]KDR40219.1 multidrug transporter MatE [Caballeronia glathei]CDY79793.1 Putative threonine efflux protein [Caballeronia glathei]